MLLSYLLFDLIGSIHNMWPIILIALIVSLIVRSNNKPNYGRVRPGEVLMDDAQAIKEKHDSNTRLNVLLYVGSFFIAGSMLLLAKDAPDVMPVILILVTLLVYGAGLILYKLVDYLQPVATAFTYTGLILFPIWYYAFESAGLTSQTALMVSTIFACISSIGATFVIESRMTGWLSYIWLIIAGWTAGNAIDPSTNYSVASTYAFFLWPLIVAVLPTICWSFRVKWLPVAFRSATKFFAEVITPVFAVLALFTMFAPDMGDHYPALRATAGALAAFNGLIAYTSNKKRSSLMAFRLYSQFFIIALFADILSYSFFVSFNHSYDNNAALVMAIVWLVSFLIQTVISLFIPQRTEEEKRSEHGILIASLIGIFFTSLFCVNFDAMPRAIILISLAVVVALLGALISWRYKDVRWSVATLAACLYIPLEIGLDLVSPYWSGWTFFAIYSILTMLFLLAYSLIPLFKSQEKHSLTLRITTIILGNIICLIASAAEGWVEAGWLVAAADVAIVAALSKRYAWLEGATYLAALSLYSLIGNLMSRGVYYEIGSPTALALSAIRIHILALPLLGFGFVKERNDSSPARLILGYLVYTLPMFTIASTSSFDKNYLWPLIFIIEQVIFLVAGLFTKRKWMTIAGIALSIITTLELTDGINSIWLLLIGVGLIAFVGWQLVKNNKKPQQ